MGQLINKRGCCHQAAPPLSCAKLLYLVSEAAGRGVRRRRHARRRVHASARRAPTPHPITHGVV